uniref:Uncharacterized protein n=1 Tax=Solanum lycopersicum TaxID=4081 RepID=A0A3Q7ENI0_SOLLC
MIIFGAINSATIQDLLNHRGVFNFWQTAMRINEIFTEESSVFTKTYHMIDDDEYKLEKALMDCTCKRIFNTFNPPKIGKDDDDNNEDVVVSCQPYGLTVSVLSPSANAVTSWVESALTMSASVSFLGLRLGLVLRTASRLFIRQLSLSNE